MAVLQRALQIARRAPIQCGAARKDLYRTLVRELTHDNALGAAERASQPARREGNAAPIRPPERHERGRVQRLVGARRLCATLASLGDGLEEGEGEYPDLGRAAWAGGGDDALTARRKIHETGGDRHAGPILIVRFKRREERRRGAGR